MKADLHCHSHFSDGKESPSFLLQRATVNGLTHLALTDHDCIDGLEPLQSEARDITIINGVELSCLWNTMEIHIVGLFIDTKNSHIEKLLASQQTQRENRAQAIDKNLQKLGTHGLMAYLQSLPCTAYTRSHIADFLVQEKICKNRQKAFKTHLGKRGRVYAAASCCSLQEGVSTILKASGIAVVAHPGRYSLSKTKLSSLLDDFKECGGEAIEGSYSNIDPTTKAYLSKLAEEKSLYLSVGSDFHDAAATWTDIGKFPALDQQAIKNAIWLHPKWHS
ncbi:MAG: phosphatase [SAR86 cluster bacterium]|uniref:Phosphatase n=1 Tax=SAR86 cluster bacterium TaxID=2030880 RepID=A0A2A4XH01_9GAMM|nr:MAG: phosphatase [SAR86 cluster bacterium]